MKQLSKKVQPAGPKPRRRLSRQVERASGIALLIVLGMLVLLSVIVLAFVTSVTTDLPAAKAYESGINTRMIADSALNLVITQVRQASTTPGNAWASQPGLIRTYDTSGSAVSAYKLYSAAKMTVSGSFDPAAGADIPPGTWPSQPNLYTDLNSPIANGTNQPLFPIIDGNAIRQVTVGGSPVLTYSTDGTSPDVSGFATDPMKAGITYTPGSTPSAANNPVPMPVQWLYMLKDGALLPATTAAGKDVAVGNGTVTPSAINPIVARVAFWTDDETSKVNINTASEGTFWDTPVCCSQPFPAYDSVTVHADVGRVYEWDLGMYQGAQREYQRYPGHPATTCLSPVLGVWIKNALFGSNLATLTNPQRATFLNAIATLSPRVWEDAPTAVSPLTSLGGVTRASGTATPDTDRLYATVDELFYSPVRGQQLTSGSQQILAASGDNARPLVEKSRFFLTTSSKAPEQNLFNKPRIAIWPVTKGTGQIDNPSDVSKMTTLDKLIAFCSTVTGTSGSPLPFYFTRQNPGSPTLDWGTRNQKIYQYLQNLTGSPNAQNSFGAIPGFGGNFGTKYSVDNDQILTEIFDYIRCINLVDTTGTAAGVTPYTGTGSFAGGQVVPIVPGSGTPGNGTRGFGRIATISELGLVIRKEDGRIDKTKMENDPIATLTYSGTTFTYIDAQHENWKNVVYGNGTDAKVGGTPYTGPDVLPLGYDPVKQTKIQCALIPDLFSPMAGFPALHNDITVVFRPEISSIKFVDQSGSSSNPFPSNPAPMTANGLQTLSTSDNECKIGGHIGAMTLIENGTTVPPTTNLFLVGGTSVLSGTVATTQPASSTVTLSSGVFAVDIYAPSSTYPGGQPVQTLNFQFPQAAIPIPKLALSRNGTAPNYTYAVGKGFPTPGGSKTGTRCDNSAGTMIQNNWWLSNTVGNWQLKPEYIFGDTVRSLAATGITSGSNGIDADFRMLAVAGTVPAAWFQPGPNYASPVSGAHSMKHSYAIVSQPGDTGGYWFSAQFGTLISGSSGTNSWGVKTGGLNLWGVHTYSSEVCAYIPGGVNGVFMSDANGQPQCGDWDNGPAFVGDGALLNKVDEGTDMAGSTGGTITSGSEAPYIGTFAAGEGSVLQKSTYFSPNRQVSSPVMFGSLPTGAARTISGTGAALPWQTLLFRPARSYLPGGIAHPGASTPPDHLLLDLFWMPVVEPYPISEPFATDGKINMNYQIVPFNYITRKTGLHAVLQSVKITAMNPNQVDYRPNQSYKIQLSDYYKGTGTYGDDIAAQPLGRNGGGVNVSVRRNIDVENTLRFFDDRFKQNKPFLSASEICTVPLVPADMTDPTGKSPYLNAGITTADSIADMEAKLAVFWNANTQGDHSGGYVSFKGLPGHYLTGDNSMERPYSLIYPRLTTKSNTYRVHMRVQSLKKSIATSPATFMNGVDIVTGEFRGSFVIERYLDPNTAGFYKNGNLGEPTTESDPAGQLGPYRFRIVSSKQFGQ